MLSTNTSNFRIEFTFGEPSPLNSMLPTYLKEHYNNNNLVDNLMPVPYRVFNLYQNKCQKCSIINSKN